MHTIIDWNSEPRFKGKSRNSIEIARGQIKTSQDSHENPKQQRGLAKHGFCVHDQDERENQNLKKNLWKVPKNLQKSPPKSSPRKDKIKNLKITSFWFIAAVPCSGACRRWPGASPLFYGAYRRWPGALAPTRRWGGAGQALDTRFSAFWLLFHASFSLAVTPWSNIFNGHECPSKLLILHHVDLK